jgi:hypothetical protein
VLGIALALPVTAGANGEALRFPNCTAMHARYPHGVGRYGAHDRTSSGNPVTNFKLSNVLYAANRGLDRDGDGVACEKH